MWAKLKKGQENVRITVRVPRDEFQKFREASPALTVSEEMRYAMKAWVRESGR